MLKAAPSVKKEHSFQVSVWMPAPRPPPKWGILGTVGKWRSSTILYQNFLQTAARERAGKKDQQLSQHLAVPLDVVSVDTVKNYLLRQHKTVVQALRTKQQWCSIPEPILTAIVWFGKMPLVN